MLLFESQGCTCYVFQGLHINPSFQCRLSSFVRCNRSCSKSAAVSLHFDRKVWVRARKTFYGKLSQKIFWIWSRTEFCMLIELVKFWSVLTSEQYAHFQWLIKLNSPSLCSQVFVDFQGFTACRFIASWLISVYFWLILPRKGCRFSAWQENSYCLWNRSSADFHGFYRTQNFCIFIESSKFWSILTFWRIFASWLNSVCF